MPWPLIVGPRRPLVLSGATPAAPPPIVPPRPVLVVAPESGIALVPAGGSTLLLHAPPFQATVPRVWAPPPLVARADSPALDTPRPLLLRGWPATVPPIAPLPRVQVVAAPEALPETAFSLVARPRLPTAPLARVWAPFVLLAVQQADDAGSLLGRALLLGAPGSALAPPPSPPPSPPPAPPVAGGERPPLVLADVVDDDTERAILLLWQTAGDVEPIDLADDDTEKAVLALWEADMQLPGLFSRLPQTGRLKSLEPGRDVKDTGPYAVLDCQFDSRTLAFADPKASAAWNDYRRVTIAIYGTRADVVQAAGAVLAVFNRKLGAPGQKALTYPSGARFIRWTPTNQVKIEEDKDAKAGRDVWKATIEAKVWSVRDV